jgi:hypothetical protein
MPLPAAGFALSSAACVCAVGEHGLALCLGDGGVVFWPHFVQAAVYNLAVPLDAPEDEPVSLTACDAATCVLATRAGYLAVVTLLNSSGKPALASRRMLEATGNSGHGGGLFGGLGRRVTSLFGFGATVQAPRPVCVLARPCIAGSAGLHLDDGPVHEVFVLTDRALQIWLVFFFFFFLSFLH